MTTSPDTVRYTAYDHTRFPAHLPFARRGYIFTISGDFPADTPSHTKNTDMEMAVFREDGEWQVRDVRGNRKAWGYGATRAGAVRAAFAVIYRDRVREAAQITDKRRAAGLEAVPPYAVEVTASVTLVVTPQQIGVLRLIEHAHGDQPVTYHVNDTESSTGYTVRTTDAGHLEITTTGILHGRCGCDPIGAARFETEDDALAHADEALTVCWPCEKTPQLAE